MPPSAFHPFGTRPSASPRTHARTRTCAAFLPRRAGAATPYPLACVGAPLSRPAQLQAASASAPANSAPARAHVLDGRALAGAWSDDVAAAVRRALAAPSPPQRPPGLTVLLVGQCMDSILYVRHKRDACAAAGISFRLVQLAGDADQEAVLSAVRDAVADTAVHGVLVQLPLPRHLDEEAILEAVGTEKDVDGFHPVNAGRLSMRGRTPTFVPCTPKGVMEMLRRAHIPVLGASAVVLGNSNTVGTPLSMLLRDCGASTVTVCHAAQDGGAEQALAAIARTADILVAAVGRPGLVREHWVKPGAAVLDVGINAVPADHQSCSPGASFGAHVSLSALREREWRIVGDVAFDEVQRVAGAITPVPGGVGPMTIAALLDNVLTAWLRAETRGGFSEIRGV